MKSAESKVLYAYVAMNPKLGREQIVAGMAGTVLVPLYAWTFDELVVNQATAIAFAKSYNVPVKLARFVGRADLETIYPPGMQPPAPKPERKRKKKGKR